MTVRSPLFLMKKKKSFSRYRKYWGFFSLFPLLFFGIYFSNAQTYQTITKTTDTDFNQGTFLNTQEQGSGTDGSVRLFYDGSPNWLPDSSWTYRKKITIDHTKVSGDLTDFPVYVDLSVLWIYKI